MAPKLKEEPAPEPEPEPEPEPDEDEDKAWARATPRLKGLFRETLNEWLDEIAEEGEVEPEPEEPRPVAPGRPTRAAAAGNGRGRTTPLVPARRQTPARPSGGSILDALLGR